MFTSGLILGMAIGALAVIIFMLVIMAQVVKQNGQQKDDVKTTNAAAREYWNFMTEETNSQTFALKQISTSLRELAKASGNFLEKKEIPMSDYFESPVLGKTRNATDEEKAVIQKSVDETAITVFQLLNKMLNSRGLCITIDALP